MQPNMKINGFRMYKEELITGGNVPLDKRETFLKLQSSSSENFLYKMGEILED